MSAATRAPPTSWPGLAQQQQQQQQDVASSSSTATGVPVDQQQQSPAAADAQFGVGAAAAHQPAGQAWTQACDTSSSANHASNAAAQQPALSSSQPCKDGSCVSGSGSHKPVLPYARTLHYTGCGCPMEWSKGGRVADLVDLLVARCHAMYAAKLLTPNRPLRVAYMLPHHNITGGMKCLVEHVRLLRERGHYTIAVHRSDSAQRAMPPWSNVEADADVVCSLRQRLSDVYPVGAIDVVVVGIFHQVAELLAGVTAPVVYWEQGTEWLFGDPIRFQVAQNYLKQDQLFHMVLHLPCALAGVSTAVQDILGQEFGRTSLLIPNGIDCARFTPGPRSGPAPPARLLFAADGALQQLQPKTVLLVGNPALPLKGFTTAISVLAAVNQVLPLHIRWVCQQRPTDATVPNLSTSGLDIDYIVSPSQEDLPVLYRGHDAFLFTSHYEAWGMPVLEAMASGLAVVTSSCFGVDTFATHGRDCLMALPEDVAGLAQHLLLVLTTEALCQQLQAAARQTALRFTPAAVVEHLEAVLYCLTACSRELLQLRQLSLGDIQFAAAWASEACTRPALPQSQ